MNSRERVATTVAHRIPDRVPLDYWAVPEVDDRLMAAFGLPDVVALRRHLKTDMARATPELKESAKRVQAGGDWYDEWGTRRHWVEHSHGGGYWEWVEFPLAEIDTIEGLCRHQWPNVDMYDWEQFSRQIGALEGLSATGGYLAIFAAYWFLRGIENALLDLALRPDFAHRLISKIAEFEYELVEKTLDVADGRLDYLVTVDDWGMQTGLMLSPAMFREFYKQPVRRAFDLARSRGVGIFCHTDGSVAELMDDLMDLEIDILNPVQTTCAGMDPRWLKRAYGSKVCFHGAVDTQWVLPRGTAEDVRQETLRRMAQFGRDGGYVVASCHRIQTDVPTENIMALYETVWEHGWYPLEIPESLEEPAAL